VHIHTKRMHSHLLVFALWRTALADDLRLRCYTIIVSMSGYSACHQVLKSLSGMDINMGVDMINDVKRDIENKIKMERKLEFRRIKMNFGFTTKEISLPLSTSPCRDSTQNK